MARRLLLAVGFGLAAVTPAAADYEEEFKAGVQAYSEQRWNDSATAMLRALRQRPTESADRVSVSAFQRVAYVPHTFLTIALARLDRCEEALAAFTRSEAQGIAARDARRYFEEASTAANGCRRNLLADSVDSTRSALEEVRELAAQVEQSVADGVGARVLSENSSIATRIEQARELLRAAGERFDGGMQASDLAAIREAADLIERTRTEWSTVRRDVNIKIAGAAPASPPARPQPDTGLRDATAAVEAAEAARQRLADRLRAAGSQRALRRRAPLRNRWEASGRQLEQLRADLRGADPGTLDRITSEARRLSTAFSQLERDVAAEERAETAAQQVPAERPEPRAAGDEGDETPTAAPGRDEVAAPPPSGPATTEAGTAEQRLGRAARSYFGGRYDESTRLLESISFPSRRELEVQRRLLLAAATWSQSRLATAGTPEAVATHPEEAGEPAAAEESARLRDRAAELLSQLWRAQPELEIPERFFSPAFRAFADLQRSAPSP